MAKEELKNVRLVDDDKLIEIALDDLDIEADSYGIAVDLPSNEMRVRFYDADGNPLTDFITDAAGAYEFAHRILRSYDKLEGI